MTKKILGLLAVAALITPSIAQAHTTLIEPLNPRWPYQHWVDVAKVPTPTVTIWLHQSRDPCGVPGAGACTDLESIWIRPDRYARATLYHEIANLISPSVPEATRARFLELSGGVGGWTTDEKGSGANYDFADAYSYCAWPSPETRPEEHLARMWPHMRAICRLIREMEIP